MTEQDIPEDVRKLILESIASVADLEALLLLRDSPEQEWTAESVARRLYIAPDVAEAVLRRLRDQGFSAPGNEDADIYRYAPRSAELSRRLDRLAETYKRRLIAVTNLIHSRPGAGIQHFADAFKLRKDG